MTHSYTSIVPRARRWLVEMALPLWAGAGVDAVTGAFHERLLPDGSPDRAAARRVRVQARQIYVYAHAAALGYYPPGATVALRAFHRLMATAYAPDARPGFVHLLSPEDSVADARRDSVDHVFLVLAFAWLARATGDAQVLAALEATLRFIDTYLTLPNGRLREGWPDTLPRRQLPHMHGFEAMIALHDALAHPDALPRAAVFRHLLETRFVDAATQTLIEHFAADWTPAAGWREENVSPGLQAEWCWMLRCHEQLAGLPASPIPRALFDTARRHADAQGLLVDAISRRGEVRLASRRSWPQTELVKGWVGEHEAGHPDARAAGCAALEVLFAQYLDKPSAGLWADQVDAQGIIVPGPISASTFYHLFVAIAEADRVWG